MFLQVEKTKHASLRQRVYYSLYNELYAQAKNFNKLHNWVYIIIMLRLIAFSTDSTLMSRTTLRVLIRLENNSTIFQVLSFLLLILAVTYTRLVTLQLRNSQSSAAFFPTRIKFTRRYLDHCSPMQ